MQKYKNKKLLKKLLARETTGLYIVLFVGRSPVSMNIIVNDFRYIRSHARDKDVVIFVS